MIRIDIPEEITLADGTALKLAPLAWNRNLRKLMAAGRASDEEASLDAVEACVRDCIRNANKQLTPEEVEALAELIPSNVYLAIMPQNGTQQDKA